jgi:hypothetical protein
MFRITDKTCRAFSLAEILIMAAINVESSRAASRTCIRTNTAVRQRG